MVIIVGSGKRAAKDIYSVQSVRVWWVILENVGGEVGDPMDNFEDIRLFKVQPSCSKCMWEYSPCLTGLHILYPIGER